MADLRDEHGNPIQLADEYGNPVQLTDEHGNPVNIKGVATTAHTTQPMDVEPPPPAPAPTTEHLQEQPPRSRSSSSSSSSEEEDEKGGRRKKKGLKQKIKETFGGGKQETMEESAVPATTVPGSKTAGTVSGLAPEHEKKGVMDKIKEKLPGHH